MFVFSYLVFYREMALPPTPQSYNDAVVPLTDQFPYGEDFDMCCIVQSVAWHYGLLKGRVQALRTLKFDTVTAFSLVNPNGDSELRGNYRLLASVFDSQITRSKILRFVHLLRNSDIFPAIPVSVSGESSSSMAPLSGAQPAPPVAPHPTASLPPKKKRKGAAVPSSGADESAAAEASAPASGEKKSVIDYDSTESEEDDSGSDDDDASAGAVNGDSSDKKQKASKTDKTSREANSMVAEIGDAVSFSVRACLICIYPLSCVGIFSHTFLSAPLAAAEVVGNSPRSVQNARHLQFRFW